MSSLNQFTGGATKIISVGTPLTLTKDDLVYNITLIPTTGTLGITGPSRFRGVASDTITIPQGTPVTLGAAGAGPLVGFTFTASDTVMAIINQ